ncbi:MULTISPECIES: LysR family transcriptional regulator [unclassified Thioalkalivibrio]|uniref:LysR family transcriptional regulator n=1 Tax=unclassified Thioalkalivibrio TaxID=2621013 RepID=UPI00035E6C02|nr:MULTISPECIES: LysR family transcriptional regulator [unclassified Thioalkalivibrio]PYG03913.1 DNA-binding transcriptional LysR family regulator [Thioalkalivibrio sp. ALE21]
MSRVTLEQWRMLKAVVDAGGFARAAERVHKSASSVNHAVQKLEEQLGVEVFQLQGRKAELTPAGHALLRRAEHLLEEAADIEALAGALATGVESELHLAVEQIIPAARVIHALEAFSREQPATRIQLHEVVLEDGPQRLEQGRVDMLLAPQVPSDFLAQEIGEQTMVCVAHPGHPLARSGAVLTRRDLRPHRQVVLRDSGARGNGEGGWLDADQRWTVGHVSTVLEVLRSGVGFAWVPLDRVADDLASGRLAELVLEAGGRMRVPFYLTLADGDAAGVAGRTLADALRTAFQSLPTSTGMDP